MYSPDGQSAAPIVAGRNDWGFIFFVQIQLRETMRRKGGLRGCLNTKTNGRNLKDEIEDLVTRKRYTELRESSADTMEAADIALVLEDLGEENMPLVFRLLPKEPAAEVFVELDSDEQELLIRGFSNTELREVLDELYLDDAVDIGGGDARQRGQAHSEARRPGDPQEHQRHSEISRRILPAPL
jgi:hypothetical protein